MPPPSPSPSSPQADSPTNTTAPTDATTNSTTTENRSSTTTTTPPPADAAAAATAAAATTAATATTTTTNGTESRPARAAAHASRPKGATGPKTKRMCWNGDRCRKATCKFAHPSARPNPSTEEFCLPTSAPHPSVSAASAAAVAVAAADGISGFHLGDMIESTASTVSTHAIPSEVPTTNTNTNTTTTTGEPSSAGVELPPPGQIDEALSSSGPPPGVDVGATDGKMTAKTHPRKHNHSNRKKNTDSNGLSLQQLADDMVSKMQAISSSRQQKLHQPPQQQQQQYPIQATQPHQPLSPPPGINLVPPMHQERGGGEEEDAVVVQNLLNEISETVAQQDLHFRCQQQQQQQQQQMGHFHQSHHRARLPSRLRPQPSVQPKPQSQSQSQPSAHQHTNARNAPRPPSQESDRTLSPNDPVRGSAHRTNNQYPVDVRVVDAANAPKTEMSPPHRPANEEDARPTEGRTSQPLPQDGAQCRTHSHDDSQHRIKNEREPGQQEQDHEGVSRVQNDQEGEQHQQPRQQQVEVDNSHSREENARQRKEEDEAAYKAQRKALKKQRQHKERLEKVFSKIEKTRSKVSLTHAWKIWRNLKSESRENMDSQKRLEVEAPPKQQEGKGGSNRASGNSKSSTESTKGRKAKRHEKYLQEQEKLGQQRIDFWKKEIRAYEQGARVIEAFCIAEFVRQSRISPLGARFELSIKKVESNEEVRAKFLAVGQEAFRALFQDDLKTRFTVANFNTNMDGRSGTVHRWDHAKQKFRVGLDTKKGKGEQEILISPANMDFNSPEPGGKKRKRFSHVVEMKDIWYGLDLHCTLEKGDMKTLIAADNKGNLQDRISGFMGYLNDEAKRQREEQEDYTRQEEESRRRRAERRAREEEVWKARRQQYQQRKRAYEEWRNEERHRTQARNQGFGENPHRQSRRRCDCPECMFVNIFSDFVFSHADDDGGGGCGRGHGGRGFGGPPPFSGGRGGFPGGPGMSFGRGGRAPFEFFFAYDDDDSYDSTDWDDRFNAQHEEEILAENSIQAEVLGLQFSDELGQDQIKREYRKLALKYHPDKFRIDNQEGLSREQSEDRFKRIQNAYDHLMGNFDD